jgi:adenylate cyclase
MKQTNPMQQLTLFNNPMSRKPRSTTRKRLATSARAQHAADPQWDLWAQEKEIEKEMALFFLDIRNFTPLIEKYHASDVIHIVKKLFSSFQNIIRIHRGRIIETSGDGFYAAFGVDTTLREAVNAAVKAGLAILETLEKLNVESFQKNLQQRIDVGIGVHAGEVATGNFHLGSKDHLVVMGYPVNVASRLQAATKELNNNFIVSSRVFRLLDNPPACSRPSKVHLKGVNGLLDIHLLGNSYSP